MDDEGVAPFQVGAVLAQPAGGFCRPSSAYPRRGAHAAKVLGRSRLRIGELAGLREEDVDLDKLTIAVVRQADRYQPWPATVPQNAASGGRRSAGPSSGRTSKPSWRRPSTAGSSPVKRPAVVARGARQGDRAGHSTKRVGVACDALGPPHVRLLLAAVPRLSAVTAATSPTCRAGSGTDTPRPPPTSTCTPRPTPPQPPARLLPHPPTSLGRDGASPRPRRSPCRATLKQPHRPCLSEGPEYRGGLTVPYRTRERLCFNHSRGPTRARPEPGDSREESAGVETIGPGSAEPFTRVVPWPDWGRRGDALVRGY